MSGSAVAVRARPAPAPVVLREVMIVRSGEPGVLWPRLWGTAYTAMGPDGTVLARSRGFWRLRAVLKSRLGAEFRVPMQVLELGARPSWLWPRDQQEGRSL